MIFGPITSPILLIVGILLVKLLAGILKISDLLAITIYLTAVVITAFVVNSDWLLIFGAIGLLLSIVVGVRGKIESRNLKKLVG